MMVATTADQWDETTAGLMAANWAATKVVSMAASSVVSWVDGKVGQLAVVSAAQMVATTVDEWDQTMAGLMAANWAAM